MYGRDEPLCLSSAWIHKFNRPQLPFVSFRAAFYNREIWTGPFRPVFQSYGMQVWPLVEMRGHDLGMSRLQLQQEGCSGWKHPRPIPGWSPGVRFGLEHGFGTALWYHVSVVVP